MTATPAGAEVFAPWPTPDQIINNPVSGERITFLQTSADTDGELLDIELELTPDGHVPGMHVHPTQTERFEVLEGTMTFRMGRKKVTAGPGEVVVVPAGKAHKFANGGDDDAPLQRRRSPRRWTWRSSSRPPARSPRRARR